LRKLIISLSLILSSSVVLGIFWAYSSGPNSNGVASRPMSVPITAKWVGGADGGDWIDCKIVAAGRTRCAIYNDYDGSLTERATFLGGLNMNVEDVSFYDGQKIVTIDQKVYPKVSPVPEDSK